MIVGLVTLGCTEWMPPASEGGHGAKVEDGESLALTWRAVPTTAHPPCDQGLAVYDAARAEVLYVGNGSVLQMPWAACNSTWSYDGADWVQVADNAHSPSWRIDSALAYDPVRERVVLFGGQKIQGNAAPTNEVWEWDGAAWSNRTPPSTAIQPEPMAEPGLEFDPASGRLLLFGGTVKNKTLYDTWSWDGAAWTRIDTKGPWTLQHAAWNGEALVGLGNGVSGFGGYSELSWDGAHWTEGAMSPFMGSTWAFYDPSPGVSLFAYDPTKIYWRGPDGFELRATSGDPLPNQWPQSAIFVYDPALDRTVVWDGTWGDTVMELDAQEIADVPPAFASPPDELRFDVGYRTSALIQATAPDGDPVTLRLEDLPDTPWPVLTDYPPTAWALVWEPEADQIGEYDVTLVLSDGTVEVRHPVHLVVGLRELPGFPEGSFTSSGSAEARIGEAGSSITYPVDVDCTLTVDNPGNAQLGCSADFPFWIERSVESGFSSPTQVLVDLVQLTAGTQAFQFEEWGVSTHALPLGDPWTWATGSITETADGYDVVVAPFLPSGLDTSLGALDEPLQTTQWATVKLWKPAVRTVDQLLPGDLVITEILRNPKAVADAVGEWFEVQNVSGVAVDLDGLEVWDADTDRGAIVGSVVVPAGGYAVIAVNGDPAVNGGVTPDAVVGDTILANGADELFIGLGATVVDGVAWGSTGWVAPNGASMTLAAGGTAVTNDSAASWTAATAAFGAGDKGTPGGP